MLSNTLKSLRNKNRMSQQKLADIIGITQQAVAKWENGKAEPDTETLVKLADIFQVSTDYLLGKDDGKNRTNVRTYPRIPAAHIDEEGPPVTEDALPSGDIPVTKETLIAELDKFKEEIKQLVLFVSASTNQQAIPIREDCTEEDFKTLAKKKSEGKEWLHFSEALTQKTPPDISTRPPKKPR